MVFFTCSQCGESLKKAQVEKHRFKCYARLLTCVDCLKDFKDDEYQGHTKCISENQKYGGQNFVAKVNKGEAKQERWIELVQSAIDKLTNSTEHRQLKDLLKYVSSYSNIPRKEAKFKNFLKNSSHYHRYPDLIAQAWTAISTATTEVAASEKELDKRSEDLKSTTSNSIQVDLIKNDNDEPLEELANKNLKKKSKKRNCAEVVDSQHASASEPRTKKFSDNEGKLSEFQTLNSNDHKFQKTTDEELEVNDEAVNSETIELMKPLVESPEITEISTDDLKSIIKRLLKAAVDRELTVKRLKKLVMKEMGSLDKNTIYTKVEDLLLQNNKKFATDGKIVRFATKA